MAVITNQETAQGLEAPLLTHATRLARAGGWWTLFLAVLMLGSVAEAIHAARWSEGLEVVRLAIIGGGLLGFALAITRFGSHFSALYALAAGTFWIIVSVQRVLLPDLRAPEAVEELILRSAGWIAALYRGGAGADNLIFVLQLSIVGWWLGYAATWQLFRNRSVLYAAVPAGLALLINLYYSPLRLSGYLLVFLVAVLLLAVRMELAKNESRWQLTGIRYAPDIYIDFVKAGIIFAVVAVLASWAMPSIADKISLERVLRPLERPWQTIEDTWSRMYQSVNYPGSAPVSTRYGKDLALGGPVSLGDRLIFEGQFPVGTYWRATTYDQYDGRGWTNTDRETAIIEHDQWLGEPLFAATAEMTATLQPAETGQDIFAPPQPVRVSLPVDADLSRISEDGALVSVSRMQSRLARNSPITYQVVSAVTEAPPSLLRADSQEYPTWVTQRYLHLPENVPNRVVELAHQVADSHDTAFDKASAIEAFLRQYSYNTDIAAPPEGVDAVEHFLFDLKEGYCDYYASAMVVMLRAVGIPSRLVAGYAPGELIPARSDQDASDFAYQILERDAHAWVEAFFPTYGWIQFEPTAARQLIPRPSPAVVASTRTPIPPEEEDESLKDLRGTGFQESGREALTPQAVLASWIEDHVGALLAGAAVLALALVTSIILRRQYRTFLRSPQLLAGLLGAVGRWATRLRVPWPASDTVTEHARRFGLRVPGAASVVDQMAALFAAQRYGRQNPPSETVQTLANEWRGLQPRLWRRWIQQIFQLRANSAPPASPTSARRAGRRWGSDRGQPPEPSQRI